LILTAVFQASPVAATWLNGTAETWIEGDTVQGFLGDTVTGAGDVNGDGYDDLLVGAPGIGTQPGKAYLFYGGPKGVAARNLAEASARIVGASAGSRFGFSLSGGGDVDGDGYDDILVGAYGEAGGAGAAYLFRGGPGGITASSTAGAAVRFTGDQAGAGLGRVAWVGDVNGDGYDDAVIGAGSYDLPGKVNAGVAYLFLGGSRGIVSGSSTLAAARFEGGRAEASLGAAAGAGDVNKDGYDDVLLGAPGAEAAYVFQGGPAGPAGGGPEAAATRLTWAAQSGAYFGSALAGAGDINGDGYADIVIGAYSYNNRTGAAFIFQGGPSGIAGGDVSTAAARINGDQADGTLGGSVAGAGDVNGDGFDDVIIACNAYDLNGARNTGLSLLYLGGPQGIASGSPSTATKKIFRLEDWGGSASSVAAAGDLNGDGVGDIVIGAVGHDVAGMLDPGGFAVYLGQWEAWRPGLPSGPTLKLPGPGGPLAEADVNGDGYADVVAGVPGYDADLADQGAAFLYMGGPGGMSLSPAARLRSGQAGARMGTSVAAAGDVNGDGYDDIVIGAHFWDGPAGVDQGAAFVFFGSPSGIQSGTAANANVRLLGSQAGARLGFSVSGAGDVNGDGYADIVAGAPFYNMDLPDQGAVLVFPGGPEAQPAAMALLTYETAGMHLGFAVAGAGDVDGDGYADILAGAPNFGTVNGADTGIAFLFRGGPAGPGPQPASALRSYQAGAQFGHSVAGAGDVNGDGHGDVLVGAHHYDAGTADEGAAFLYLGNEIGLAEAAPAAVYRSGQTGSEMGVGVAAAGDVDGDGFADIVVGAPLYDVPAGKDGGAAFLFLGSPNPAGGGPDQAAARYLAGSTGANLGRGVTGAGDVDGDGYADLIVGAPLVADGQGRAYLHRGGPGAGIAGGGPGSGAWRIGAFPSDHPYTAARAGDVNGDGYGDLIVGVPGYDGGQQDEGAVFVILGKPGGIAASLLDGAVTRIESNQPFAAFGASVAPAGDVNADGYADILVGAPSYSDGQTFEGGAFVFHGGPNGIAATDLSGAAGRIESDLAMAGLGSSVARAGDVNGDGYDDVVVAAPSYGDRSAFVFLGGTGGIGDNNPATASVILPGYLPDERRFSYAVAGAGDVNRDGYDDVLVGDPCYGAEWLKNNQGAVFLFLGGPSGTAATPAARIKSGQEGALLGRSVAGAGDVDGDGYDDVIVGAPGPFQGAAYLFRGGPGGITGSDLTAAAFQVSGRQSNAELGTTVAAAGDVNADGFADVAVGSLTYDEGLVIYGGPDATRLKTSPPLGLRGAAGAGDVDGDGYDDVIVADWASRSGDELFLFRGNGGRPGRDRNLRQRRRYEELPVQPGGTAHEDRRFRIQVFPSHPAGQGRVKLEAEICRLDLPYGNAGCAHAVSPDWVKAPGFVDLLVEGLAVGQPARWRVRELYAPPTGIFPPRQPAHGPWRRVAGRTGSRDLSGGIVQRVTLSLSRPYAEFFEGVQAYTDVVLTAHDHHPLRIPARVSYRTTDGTALVNQDYNPVSGTFVFPAGTPDGERRPINVPILQDNLREADETFRIDLAQPLGAEIDGYDRNTILIRDDDTVGVERCETGVIETDENGARAAFTVRLTSRPAAKVVLAPSVSDAKEAATVSGPLTFDSADAAAGCQAVTVQGVDDPLQDGTVAYDVILTASSDSDGPYRNRSWRFAAANKDREEPGLVIEKEGALVTDETGRQATFKAALASQPLSNVVLSFVADPAEGSVRTEEGSGSIVFTSADWDRKRTVTITGLADRPDPVDEPDRTYILAITASSTDRVYAGWDPDDLAVTNLDTDPSGPAGLAVQEAATGSNRLRITEGGSQAFHLALTSRPRNNVTVAVQPPDGITAAPASLEFTPATWSQAREVVLTAANDDEAGVESAELDLVLDPDSADDNYRALPSTILPLRRLEDDVAGFLVSPDHRIVRAGGPAVSFDVAATSRPVPAPASVLLPGVYLPLISGNPGAGTASPGALEFPDGEETWKETRQGAVTPTGQSSEAPLAWPVELGPAQSADIGYAGLVASPVTIVRAGTRPGLTVAPTQGLATSEDGGTAAFEVALNTRPGADVVVELTSSDPMEGVPSPASLRFTPDDWSAVRTVTVTGQDDGVDDGPALYTIHLSGPDPRDVELVNLAPLAGSTAARVIVLAPAGGLTLQEGGTGTFGVVLSRKPEGRVTLALRPSAGGLAGLVPPTLVFGPHDWSLPRQVAVTALNDSWADGGKQVDVGISVSTLDPAFSGAPPPVPVAVVDDDEAGFLVSPTRLITRAGGPAVSFQVAARSRPRDLEPAGAVLPVSVQGPGAGSVDRASLEFSTDEETWDDARVVRVTPASTAPDEPYTWRIGLGPSSSGDPAYRDLVPASVTVVQAGALPGLTVAPLHGLVTTEDGGTASFSVALNTRPEAGLTVTLTNSDEGEGIASATSLVFTAEDWKTVRTVSVAGQPDGEDDGAVSYKVTLTAPGLTPVEVELVNLPSASTPETPAQVLVLAPAGGLTIREGGFATFDLVLSRQPASAVEVELTADPAGPGSVDNNVVFAPGDWSQPHPVTVRAADDSIYDGSRTFKAVTGLTGSDDSGFDGLDPADVSVTVLDDDAAEVSLSYLDTSATTEAGGTASIGLGLNGRPLQDTTFTIRSAKEAEGTVDPATVTVPAAGTGVPDTITLTATGANDDYADGNVFYDVEVEATSGDPAFTGLGVRRITLVNLDDDIAGFRVSPTHLITRPGGAPAGFEVEVTSRPKDGNVNLSVTSSNATLGTVAPAGLTFPDRETGWSNVQQAAVTPVGPPTENSVSYQIVFGPAEAADPAYRWRSPSPLTVVQTGTRPGLTVTPLRGLVTTEDGGTASFSVALNVQPEATLTVTLASSDEGEGISSITSLVFTPEDWEAVRTITVTGQPDEEDDGPVSYKITLTGAGLDPVEVGLVNLPAATTPNVQAEVLVLAPAGGLTLMEGGVATFDLVLSRRPDFDVWVSFQAVPTGFGYVEAVQIRPREWSLPHTVTVHAFDNAVYDRTRTFQAVATTWSPDPDFNELHPGDTTITVLDNDSASIALSTDTWNTTEAGGKASIGLNLNGRPAQDTIFSIRSTNEAEGKVGLATVIVPAAGTGAPDTITFTVTGANDDYADGNVFYDVEAEATSGDPAFTSLGVRGITLINVDDDFGGFRVSPTHLIARPGGTPAGFEVKVTSRPKDGDVNLSVASSNETLGTVAPAGLTFPDHETDWSDARQATVTPVGPPTENSVSYQIVLGPAEAADPAYRWRSPGPITVVQTGTRPGLTVTPLHGLVTTEDGGTASFSVALNVQPEATLTVTLTSSDEGEGIPSVSSLVFTPEDWEAVRTITVTGQPDDENDGPVSYKITLTGTGLDPVEVDLVNLPSASTPNVQAEVLVLAPAGGLTIQEGGFATFDLALSRRPAFDVWVDFQAVPADFGYVDGAILISVNEWNLPHPVTVHAFDDAIYNRARTFQTVATTWSPDSDFNELHPADVSVAVLDNDAANFNLAYADSSITTEARGTATFKLTLNGRPAEDTIFTIHSTNEAEGTIGIGTVEIPAMGEGVPDPVSITVAGADDDYDDGDAPYDVEVQAVQGDPAFIGVGAHRISFVNLDDDFAGYQVSPLTVITRPGGPPASFDVGIHARPRGGDLHLPAASTAPDRGTVEPSEIVLSGDASGWRETRRAFVIPAGAASEDAYQIRLGPAQSADPSYNGSYASSVTVVRTGSHPGLTVAPVQGLATTEAGGIATFQVALNSPPASDLTVTLTSSDPGEGRPSAASLVFTSADWQAVRTVTVTGQPDGEDDGPVQYTVTVAPAAGSGLDPVTVYLVNLPAPGPDVPAAVVVLAPPAGITVREGDLGTFAVVLSRPPADRVIVRSQTGDFFTGTVFSPWNWNVPRFITVPTVDDNVVNGTRTFQAVLTPTSSADPAFDGLDPADVIVTILDDDTWEGSYDTITPCRIYDSRLAAPGGDRLVSGQERVLQIVGDACQIPARATAVALNLTALSPTERGNLAVYPAGENPPATSAINFVAGLNRANNGIFRLSADGRLAIRAFVVGNGTLDFAVDLVGFFE
jgi:hypothetical protein